MTTRAIGMIANLKRQFAEGTPVRVTAQSMTGRGVFATSETLGAVVPWRHEATGAWYAENGDPSTPNTRGKPPVKFHHPLKTARDVTGTMCCLLGWRRASTLLGHIEWQIYRRRRVHRLDRLLATGSLGTLQPDNDHPRPAVAVVLAPREAMPVWTGVLHLPDGLKQKSTNSRNPS